MTTFSFLLPTRQRPDLVKRFFDSIVATTERLDELEIVLAADDDDAASQAIEDPRLRLEKVVVPRGSTMGALNRACYAASAGRFVMLVNDDIVLRTLGWDARVKEAIATLPDDVCLVHVNDLLFRERLCTFPLLSRAACEAIGVCPEGYRRYRIDDHVYDTYNMLAYLGHPRILYLPDVVFEHENHEQQKGQQGHTFASAEGKVYVPDQAIMGEDAPLFDRLFEQRKRDARTLAGLIEDAAAGRRAAEAARLLEGIGDSFGYRRPEFVRTVSAAAAGGTRRLRTTIAVSTADYRSGHAKTCLERIKAHTEDAILVVMDNGRSKEFSHPRDMNQILRSAQTDLVVIMDDDVFVEPGWLEAMVRALDDETAVVCPLHKDGDGNLSFAGAYFSGDSAGSHLHLFDPPEAVREIPCYCSAIILVDRRKVGSVLMDESYAKYFFDIVHGLEVWERGYRAVVTPEVSVTHLGGATMVRGTQQANGFWQSDGALFASRWVRTGRLAALEDGIWQRYPFTRQLVEEPRFIKRALSRLGTVRAAQIPEIALAALFAHPGRDAYRALVQECLYTATQELGLAGDDERAKRCVATLAWLAGRGGQLPPPNAEQTAASRRLLESLAAGVAAAGAR